MKDFKKVVRVGAFLGEGHVYCSIEWKEKNLSITGVIGPKRNGDAVSCGQINESLRADADTLVLASGWDIDTLIRFLDVWDEWHLNDLVAGSPAQTAFLAGQKGEFPGHPTDFYTWASKVLIDRGINPDFSYLIDGEPYSYGSKWLRKEVPENVLEFLQSLPDTERVRHEV